MGYYTTVDAKFTLKEETPPWIVRLVQWMTWKDWKGADKREYDRDYKTIYPKTPDHPFFKTHRWYSVLIADEPGCPHHNSQY
jgi:hypothetical protein